jgi:DNA-binding CsgD family transcriptional regulator
LTTRGYSSALSSLAGLISETASPGGLAIVEGAIGSGKTHLLREFTRKAADAGALTLTATGSPAEQTLQAGVIDQLFRSAGLPADLSARATQLVRSDETGLISPAHNQVVPDYALVSWLHELCGSLLQLCAKRQVVITIDDLQFVDTTSLRLLQYLLRRMNGTKLLLILSKWRRAQPKSLALPGFCAELGRYPHHKIRLAPLSRKNVTELLAEYYGAADTTHLAKEYHGLTGGNPMLIHALLEDNAGCPLTGSTEVPKELTVGVEYRHAVVACLYRWEPPLLDVACVAAALGTHSTPALIARVLGIRGEVTQELIEILHDAGIMLDGKLRHPLSAAAVLGTMSPNERSAIHLKVAELLYENGATATDVARHLVSADEIPGEWVITVLRDAAEQAEAANEPTTAIRCLKMALAACTTKHERIVIQHHLARAVWKQNPSAANPYVPGLQEAVRVGELSGAGAAEVVRYTLWHGDEEAAAAMTSVFTAAPDDMHPQTAAELSVAYHWFLGPARGRRYSFGTKNPVHKDPWIDTATRLTALWTRGSSDAATTSAEHILRSCQIGDTALEMVGAALLALMCGNKLDLAHSWCDRLIQQAIVREEVTWEAVLRSFMASIAVPRGDLATATREARHALDLLPANGWGVVIGQPRAALATAKVMTSQHQEASDILQQPVPDAMFGTIFSLHYLQARGHSYLATGQTLAAGRDFQLCGRLAREWEVDVPTLFPWRTDLAKVNLELGRVVEARELVRQQLDRTRATDVRIRGISFMSLAAASDLGQRTGLLRQSIECLREAGDRLELANALTALSDVHQELGEFDRARMLTRRAAQLTQPTTFGPATPICQTGTTASAMNGQPDKKSGHQVLSEAEHKVAELAALGHTNREISRMLFITVSTVEQHLTRVYKKLGITRRKDLPVERELHAHVQPLRVDEVS